MEGTEAQLAAGRLDESLSPRRRIETNRQITPGGTVVTTTTTTTEKPRDTRLDSHYNGGYKGNDTVYTICTSDLA